MQRNNGKKVWRMQLWRTDPILAQSPFQFGLRVLRLSEPFLGPSGSTVTHHQEQKCCASAGPLVEGCADGHGTHDQNLRGGDKYHCPPALDSTFQVRIKDTEKKTPAAGSRLTAI